jgi:acetyl-CoA C-acetyltransferase
MESMSNCPYLMPRARDGARMGKPPIVDSMINDGLWCAFENYHMVMRARSSPASSGVGRDAQDAFAVRSHQKAAARATTAGAFTDEILPVRDSPQRDGPP